MARGVGIRKDEKLCETPRKPGFGGGTYGRSDRQGAHVLKTREGVRPLGKKR